MATACNSTYSRIYSVDRVHVIRLENLFCDRCRKAEVMKSKIYFATKISMIDDNVSELLGMTNLNSRKNSLEYQRG